LQALIRRQFMTDLAGSLAYRFQRQDSDNDLNDYDENSLFAQVTVTF